MSNQQIGDVSIERMEPMYFNSNNLMLPSRQLYRFDKGGYRYYYYFDEENNPVFYESVTTVIQNALPTSPFLIKWIAEMGYNEAQRYKNERAAFGSFMHTVFAEFLIDGVYELDLLEANLFEYMKRERIRMDLLKPWADECRKDLLSFAQFIIDYDVEPLAVEITLSSDKMGTSGTLDLPCMMTIEEKGFWGEKLKSGPRKGQDKETKKQIRACAIIDFKSGKGFYEAHEIQLHACKRLWEENFPDAPKVTKLFNWAPNDWREYPTYKLKDQTHVKSAQKLDAILELSHIEDSRKERQIVIIKGQLKIKESFAENLTSMNFAELVESVRPKLEPKKGFKQRIELINQMEAIDEIESALKGERSIKVKEAARLRRIALRSKENDVKKESNDKKA